MLVLKFLAAFLNYFPRLFVFLQASTFSAFKIWFHMESFESLTFCVSDAICERDHDSNSQVNW